MYKAGIINSILITLLVCSISSGLRAQKKRQAMHLFHKGTLVDVYIDKALYKSRNSKFFYLRIQLRNNTGKKVGVDLDEYWEVIFPNQWIIHSIDRDREALERQEEPQTIYLRKEKLKRDLKNNRIAAIEPGGTLDYFRDYPSGKAKDIQVRKGEMINITFDGELYMTDGENFEMVQSFDENKVYRTMYLMYPVRWENLPSDALIIKPPEEDQQ